MIQYRGGGGGDGKTTSSYKLEYTTFGRIGCYLDFVII